MMKKKLIMVMMAFVLALGIGGAAEATVAYKQIKVNYSDIKLNVNGKNITILPVQEPFMLNGTTFVPLRLVSEALNCNVVWQGQTKTVLISGKPSEEVAGLRQQVLQKDAEIANLKKQIEDLKSSGSNRNDDDDLEDLEEELIDDYDWLEDVRIDSIILDGDEDEVDVEIEVDLGDYDDEWGELSDSDIENWLEDLVEYIQDELDEETEVNGEIYDTDEDEVLVEFSKDGEDDLDVEFEDDDYRDGGSSGSSSDVDDVIEGLEDDTYSIGDMEFNAYDIRYYEDYERVRVYLEAETSNPRNVWNGMRSSDIENDVESICETIVEAFEDDADIDLETVLLYVYENESSGYLDSFSYDVDDESLD